MSAYLFPVQYYYIKWRVIYINSLPHVFTFHNTAGLAFGFAQCIPFVAYSVVMLFGGYLVDIGEMPYENVFKWVIYKHNF